MGLKETITAGVIVAGTIGIIYEGNRIGHRIFVEPRIKNAKLYEESQKPIIAKVLKESYQNTLSPVPAKHISGLVSQAYSNETVKLDSKYTLKLQTTTGRILSLSVIDGLNKSKEGLDMLIKGAEEVGIENASNISFPKGNIRKPKKRGPEEVAGTYLKETWFYEETQTGTKRADRIRVLE